MQAERQVTTGFAAGSVQAAGLVLLVLAGLAGPPGPARAEDAPAGADIAQPLATIALAEYYRVYEHWPSNWAELRREGFVQVDLHSADGRLIDLDDKKLDFPGDMRYVAPMKKYQPARILTQGATKASGVQDTKIDPPQTYRNAFMFLPLGYDYHLPDIDDKPRLKLLSLAALMRQGVANFTAAKGRVPKSWDELIGSGLAPLDRNSLNPVSGKPFAGDGRPDDLIYITSGAENYGRLSWQLLATDKAGNQISIH